MEVAQDVDPTRAQRPAHADVSATLAHPVHGEPDDAEHGDGEQYGTQYSQLHTRGSRSEVGAGADLVKSRTLDDPLPGQLEQLLLHCRHRATDVAGARTHDIHHRIVEVVVGEKG